MATTVNIFDILSKVYGPKGLPFPAPPNTGTQPAIASGFEFSIPPVNERSQSGTPIRKYTQDDLGRYEFLPAMLDGILLPNSVVIITGEKSIVETDVVDVGTVFEKVFTRPYDISIICTLIGENKNWPEDQVIQMANLWKQDDVLTLKCALTDVYLEQAKDNFIIKRIAHLDAEGAENVEIIQFDGRSNIDFELELL
ncbi:MAG: DUF6046 domain-containing protein [Ginsengibacter sp.]